MQGSSLVNLARLPAKPWQAGHRGVDVAAETGAAVVAPIAGEIAFAAWVVDRPVVTIRGDHGVLVALEPVDTTLSVGERVERLDAVGTVANAVGHCAPQACVHWSVRRDGAYVDPLDCLDGFGAVVLLPVG